MKATIPYGRETATIGGRSYALVGIAVSAGAATQRLLQADFLNDAGERASLEHMSEETHMS